MNRTMIIKLIGTTATKFAQRNTDLDNDEHQSQEACEFDKDYGSNSSVRYNQINHIFIGPRYTLGPIYGSECLKKPNKQTHRPL